MQATEQADLTQRLLDSDELVLDEVLQLYGPMIIAVMSQRYHNVLRDTDVEDALSIGLFRLWKSRHRFDEHKASLKVWFFRIVENSIRDLLRHGWHKARALEVATDAELLGTVDGQTHTSQRNEEDRCTGSCPTNLQLDLREIVSKLPEAQRRIITADAATPEGTADSKALGKELNLPASTIRVYRKRAMDRIRSELAKRGHDVPGH